MHNPQIRYFFEWLWLCRVLLLRTILMIDVLNMFEWAVVVSIETHYGFNILNDFAWKISPRKIKLETSFHAKSSVNMKTHYFWWCRLSRENFPIFFWHHIYCEFQFWNIPFCLSVRKMYIAMHYRWHVCNATVIFYLGKLLLFVWHTCDAIGIQNC